MEGWIKTKNTKASVLTKKWTRKFLVLDSNTFTLLQSDDEDAEMDMVCSLVKVVRVDYLRLASSEGRCFEIEFMEDGASTTTSLEIKAFDPADAKAWVRGFVAALQVPRYEAMRSESVKRRSTDRSMGDMRPIPTTSTVNRSPIRRKITAIVQVDVDSTHRKSIESGKLGLDERIDESEKEDSVFLSAPPVSVLDRSMKSSRRHLFTGDTPKLLAMIRDQRENRGKLGNLDRASMSIVTPIQEQRHIIAVTPYKECLWQTVHTYIRAFTESCSPTPNLKMYIRDWISSKNNWMPRITQFPSSLENDGTIVDEFHDLLSGSDDPTEIRMQVTLGLEPHESIESLNGLSNRGPEEPQDFNVWAEFLRFRSDSLGNFQVAEQNIGTLKRIKKAGFVDPVVVGNFYVEGAALNKLLKDIGITNSTMILQAMLTTGVIESNSGDKYKDINMYWFSQDTIRTKKSSKISLEELWHKNRDNQISEMKAFVQLLSTPAFLDYLSALPDDYDIIKEILEVTVVHTLRHPSTLWEDFLSVEDGRLEDMYLTRLIMQETLHHLIFRSPLASSSALLKVLELDNSKAHGVAVDLTWELCKARFECEHLCQSPKDCSVCKQSDAEFIRYIEKYLCCDALVSDSVMESVLGAMVDPVWFPVKPHLSMNTEILRPGLWPGFFQLLPYCNQTGYLDLLKDVFLCTYQHPENSLSLSHIPGWRIHVFKLCKVNIDVASKVLRVFICWIHNHSLFRDPKFPVVLLKTLSHINNNYGYDTALSLLLPMVDTILASKDKLVHLPDTLWVSNYSFFVNTFIFLTLYSKKFGRHPMLIPEDREDFKIYLKHLQSPGLHSSYASSISKGFDSLLYLSKWISNTFQNRKIQQELSIDTLESGCELMHLLVHVIKTGKRVNKIDGVIAQWSLLSGSKREKFISYKVPKLLGTTDDQLFE